MGRILLAGEFPSFELGLESAFTEPLNDLLAQDNEGDRRRTAVTKVCRSWCVVR